MERGFLHIWRVRQLARTLGRRARVLPWSVLGFALVWLGLSWAWADVSYLLLGPASSDQVRLRADPAYGLGLGIMVASLPFAVLLHAVVLVGLDVSLPPCNAHQRTLRGALAALASWFIIVPALLLGKKIGGEGAAAGWAMLIGVPLLAVILCTVGAYRLR